MLALSIRQPYAELILRGMKTMEYRSRRAWIIGERFWIYASKGRPIPRPAGTHRQTAIRSDNLAPGPPPPWMVEPANALRLFPGDLSPRSTCRA